MSERRNRAVRVIAYCLAPIALLVTLLSWGLSSPVASSADEDFHLASAWCGVGLREGLCEAGSTDDRRKVPLQLIVANQCFNNVPEQAASCPALSSAVLTDTDRGNFAGIYPPLFYATMGLFVSHDISASVMAMRGFNSLLYVAMMSALFLLIPPGRRGIVIWGSLVTFVPFGVFLIASINPSSWGVISASTLWVAVLGYFEAGTRGRRIALAALALIATLVGAGSRADAAAYAAVGVVVVCVLKAERTREFLRLGALPILLVAIAVTSYLTSAQANAINPAGAPLSGSAGSVPQGWPDLLWNNIIRLPELWGGAFGAPVAGRALWLGTTAPGAIWFPAILVFGGVVFLGLRRITVRKAAGLAIIIGLLIVLPMLWLMRDHILVGQQVQARYLYPLMIIFAGVSLLGFQSASAGLGRMHLVVVALASFVGNLVIQWTTIRRFTTGLDQFWPNLDRGIEWWWGLPIGPMPLWVTGATAFGIVCALAVAYGWRSKSLAAADSGRPFLP